MYLQPLEYQCPYSENHHRNDPEIHGGIKILKKPALFKNGTAITIDDVNQGINFYDHLYPGAKLAHIPHNRSSPHTNLQKNINNLPDILEKYHNCTGAVADSQNQNKQTEAVISQLNGINTGKIAVECGNNQQYADKKQMNKGSGNNFNNG